MFGAHHHYARLGRQVVLKGVRDFLDMPSTLPLGLYTTDAVPKKGRIWWAHSEWNGCGESAPVHRWLPQMS
jgi:hypothetical protein